MKNDTISSREKILETIRRGKPTPVARPQVKIPEFDFDPLDNFRQQLAVASGESHLFGSRSEALQWLRDRLKDAEGPVGSAVADFPTDTDIRQIADPHQAHVLYASVAESPLGVGETGSVWLDDKVLGTPAAAVLCLHLYVLLDRNNIVSGIPQAYEHLPIGSTPYGAFFTGPSATADIEAVHITGAQGELSLDVLIY